MHKHGGDIYSYDNIRDFSANINDRGMPERVRAAALESVDSWVHYPDPQYRRLRQALSERETLLLGTSEAITPQQIICGNGAAELMFCLATTLRPQRALLAAPSFFEYEQSLDCFGCEIVRSYLKEEEQFQLGEEFAEQIDGTIDLVVLGNPNNPTGQLIPAGILQQIVARCQEYGCFLVLDESFFDFLTEEDQKKTIQGTQLVLNHPKLLVLKSFTKMYAMPGLRFGYGISSNEALLEQMHRQMQPWNVSAVAQAAAEEAAKEVAFARETAQRTAENREKMKRRMEESGYTVFPSQTNFLLFRGPGNLQEACIRQGYLIRDCGNFPGLLWKEQSAFYRICVRSDAENQALHQALERCLRKG
jgi:threonine-phosphate decarboxylase